MSVWLSKSWGFGDHTHLGSISNWPCEPQHWLHMRVTWKAFKNSHAHIVPQTESQSVGMELRHQYILMLLWWFQYAAKAKTHYLNWTNYLIFSWLNLLLYKENMYNTCPSAWFPNSQHIYFIYFPTSILREPQLFKIEKESWKSECSRSVHEANKMWTGV